MLRHLLLLVTVWPLFGNGQSPFRVPYQQSLTISNQAGEPVDSVTWYFPADRFIDSTRANFRVPKEQVTDAMRTNTTYVFLPDDRVIERRIVARVDTFRLKWFSYYLYRLQEPVLSNYPLGKEIYRLTWLRSFHPPVVIRMEKEGNRVRLTTKILSRTPELPGHRYADRDGSIHLTDTSIDIPFRRNTTKKIPKAVYDEYMRLLREQRALFISPLGFRDSLGSDGSEWILETHRPDGYYFIVRWSPEQTDPVRALGEYLIDLSDAKKEKRY